jgi:hypothetical protein
MFFSVLKCLVIYLFDDGRYDANAAEEGRGKGRKRCSRVRSSFSTLPFSLLSSLPLPVLSYPLHPSHPPSDLCIDVALLAVQGIEEVFIHERLDAYHRVCLA